MILDPQKVRDRREKLKLTQTKCAELSGMPVPHWNRIEAGGRPDPQLSTLARVAKALRCKITEIVSD